MAGVEAQVAHIWRRLGFGPTIDDIAAGVASGTAAVIADLCGRAATGPSDWAFPTPAQWDWEAMESLSDRIFVNFATTANPLQERIAWILNGLVVVSLDGGVTYTMIKDYAELLRRNALGSYRSLLREMTTATPMLFYLSGINSNRWHPNENYARELMELFSLGVRHPITGAANYTEGDIREIARALTGYRWHWEDDYQYFDPKWHDSGTKNFLGANRGAAAVDAVIDALPQQPAWRAYVPMRFYRELLGYDATPAIAGELGAVYGDAGDLVALVRAIAQRPEFLQDRAIGARVKSPTELVAAALRILRWNDVDNFHLTWQTGRLDGHPLFCPSVSGYAEGRKWLHAGYFMVWCQIAYSMIYRGEDDETYTDYSPTIRRLHADSTAATAGELARRLCGIAELSSGTRRTCQDYVNARPWDFWHAAGLMHLLFLSPEFVTN